MGSSSTRRGQGARDGKRRWVAVALSGLLATTGGMALGAGAGATPAEPAADAGDKVSHEVAQALDADGQATFLVRFADRPDLDALAGAVTAATAVTPGTVPTGVAAGLAAIVDGALAIIATENTPTSAVVSAELWRDIVLTGRDEVLGYLSASFGLEEGSTGGFRIIPGPVGIGKVLVSAKEARTMYELPGSPIRVEGLVPSNGAIEPALYGYIADITHNPAALALVTVATGE